MPAEGAGVAVAVAKLTCDTVHTAAVGETVAVPTAGILLEQPAPNRLRIVMAPKNVAKAWMFFVNIVSSRGPNFLSTCQSLYAKYSPRLALTRLTDCFYFGIIENSLIRCHKCAMQNSGSGHNDLVSRISMKFPG
jgi:hypothetical protein